MPKYRADKSSCSSRMSVRELAKSFEELSPSKSANASPSRTPPFEPIKQQKPPPLVDMGNPFADPTPLENPFESPSPKNPFNEHIHGISSAPLVENHFASSAPFLQDRIETPLSAQISSTSSVAPPELHHSLNLLKDSPATSTHAIGEGKRNKSASELHQYLLEEDVKHEAKPALPPRLPPRPGARVRSESTSSLGDSKSAIVAPPPLPNRPRGSQAEIAPAEEKYGSLLTRKEILNIPFTKNVNRRAPLAEGLPNTELSHNGKPKSFAFAGYSAATLHTNLRLWYIPSGENRETLSMPDVKLTAVQYLPSKVVHESGKIVWVATDKGELIEIDTETGNISDRKMAHNSAVNHMIRYNFDMITLDEHGGLKVWYAQGQRCTLGGRPRGLRVMAKTAVATIVQDRLWCANGKYIEIYNLSETSSHFLEKKIEVAMGTGPITSIAWLPLMSECYVGHEDGKITVYNAVSLEKKRTVLSAIYRIMSMVAIGPSYLWVGYSTGKIAVFDTNHTNDTWSLVKDFSAYYNSGVGILVLDETSLPLLNRSHVASVSESGHIRIWDGFLTRDKMEARMKALSLDYCMFFPCKIALLTWNIDSRKPSDMDSGDLEDRKFFKDLISTHSDADIFVIGFQELVDLESTSVTASILI